MKKVSVAIIVILISSMCYIQFNIYGNTRNKNESEKILEKAYTIIETSNENIANNEMIEGKFIKELKNTYITANEEITKNIIIEDGIIGILKIPKLNIEAPIKDGTTQEIMKTSIGHFKESNYWNGNVSFASHNGGINAHYFKNIHLLNKNDEIIYISKLGTKTYKVQEINKIKNTDWSMVLGKTNNHTDETNTITLVTCINGFENYRLCVRGLEINN